MNALDILHGPFDIETHKANFTNYLEVVVLEDGTIEYAVPSHQEKFQTLVRELGIDPVDDCPKERQVDWWGWMAEFRPIVMVWNDRIWHRGINARQRASLMKLVDEGLLRLNG